MRCLTLSVSGKITVAETAISENRNNRRESQWVLALQSALQHLLLNAVSYDDFQIGSYQSIHFQMLTLLYCDYWILVSTSLKKITIFGMDKYIRFHAEALLTLFADNGL